MNADTSTQRPAVVDPIRFFARLSAINATRQDHYETRGFKPWSRFKYFAALHGELGEANNAAKKIDRGDGNPDDLLKELADVVIYLVLGVNNASNETMSRVWLKAWEVVRVQKIQSAGWPTYNGNWDQFESIGATLIWAGKHLPQSPQDLAEMLEEDRFIEPAAFILAACIRCAAFYPEKKLSLATCEKFNEVSQRPAVNFGVMMPLMECKEF